MTTSSKPRARPAALAACIVVMISGAVFADPAAPLDPRDIVHPLLPAQGGTSVDPDMGEYADGVSKREYVMMRDAYMRQRVGALPDGVVNPRLNAALEVKRRLDQIPRIQFGNPPTNDWVPYGPDPIPGGSTYERTDPTSGRTISLAIHPTNPLIVYAGTAGGGLYRTIDGGATWKALLDQAASLAIGALALSPVNPETLYVGTGEPNLSCDSLGGVGWYRIENASTAATLRGPFDAGSELQRRSVSRIIPHPTDANQMLMGVTLGRSGVGCQRNDPVNALYRVTSINSAAPTHQAVSTLPSTAAGATDLALPATNTLLIGLITTDAETDDGIYRSTNPWSTSPAFTRVYGSAFRVEFGMGGGTTPPTIVAGVEASERVDGSYYAGAVVRSIDGGQNWVRIADPGGFCSPQCWYDQALAVHPTKPNTILIGGSAGTEDPGAAMLRSTNGIDFSTSQAGLHADTHALAFSPSHPDTVYVGNDGGIWRSTDAGATWLSRNTKGFSATQFVGVATHPTDGALIIGGTQDNGTVMRSGGVWSTVAGGDGGYTAIDGSAGGARLYHTFYATSKRIFYARYKSLADAAAGNLEIIGCRNDKKANGIDCGQDILFYPPLVLGPGSPNTIYLGSTTLWRSADGGDNHKSAGSVPDPISAIAIGPTNDNLRVVGTSGGEVYRTTNGGSLVDVTGLWEKAFVSSIVIDSSDNNTAYVSLSRYLGSAERQIWKTTNLLSAGPTWTRAAWGMPDVPVNDLAIDPRDSNTLYAATDVGVFMTANKGASWNPMAGMPIVPVYQLAVTRAGSINQRLRAATHGRGIWERFIGERTPVASLDPPALGFGGRQIGTTSPVTTLKLSNAGNITLTTGEVTQAGSASFEIVSNQCVARTLSPGMSCSIGVVYHATNFTADSGTITISSNAPGSPHSVPMSGNGSTGPLPQYRTGKRVFKWETLVPGSTVTKSVQISNSGTAALVLGTSSLVGTNAGQFRVASDGCAGVSVPPGGACTVRVSFAPSAVGGFDAALSVPNNAGANISVGLEATGQTPEVAAAAALPSSVDFGRRPLLASAIRSVELHNGGTEPVQANAASIQDDSSAAYSVVSDECAGATVMPGRSCRVDVQFVPPYFGGWSGTLALDTTGGELRVPLSGTGESTPVPAGHAEPSVVSFGTVLSGTQSGPRGIRVVSDGAAPLNVSGVRFAGADAAMFTLDDESCTGDVVDPGDGCGVSVRFAPTSAGVKTATLSVLSDGGTFTVALTGQGYASGVPAIGVSPLAMHFEPRVVATSSERHAVVVRNPGTAPLTIGLVSVAGDDPDSFRMVHDGCSLQVVPAGGACTIAIRFAPAGEGEQMATIGIASNATASPVAVLMYGSGMVAGVPEASAYPATVGFGSQIVGTSSAYRGMTLTNIGTGDVSVGAAAIDGVAAGDFAAVDYCSGRTLAPGDGCVVYASFGPRELGARAATLRLPWNGGEALIPLTGTGAEAASFPGVSLTPASLGFGYVKVDASSAAQTVTIRSTGSDPLFIERIDLGGGSMDQFVIERDTCSGGTFSPGTQCTVAVRFTPEAAGAHVASLLVTTNAGRPVVALSGTADQSGPVSTFDTADLSLMIHTRDRVSGQTQDDFAVESVTVSYVNLLGGAEQVTAAIVSCPATGRCVWRADLPTLPGIYTAVATGVDGAGNVESPGPRITIVVA